MWTNILRAILHPCKLKEMSLSTQMNLKMDPSEPMTSREHKYSHHKCSITTFFIQRCWHIALFKFITILEGILHTFKLKVENISKILSVPQNIVMDLNNVMQNDLFHSSLSNGHTGSWCWKSPH